MNSPVNRFISCPLIVLSEEIHLNDFFNWAVSENINLIQRGISNYQTLDNIVRLIIDGTIFLPFVCQQTNRDITVVQSLIYRFLGSKLSLSVLLDYIFSLFINENNKVAIGVLSLPRSGSKGLADRLALWSSPRAKVFHSHSLNDSNRCKLKEQILLAEQDGSDETLRRVEHKLRAFNRTDSIVRNATHLFIFLSERNPIERIRSEFFLKKREEIRSALHGGITIDKLRVQFRKYCLKQIEFLSLCYKQEFTQQYGLVITDINITRWNKYGYDILRSDSATLVIFKISKYDALLSSHLPAILVDQFKLISNNSASERMYYEEYQLFLREINFPEDIIELLFNIPEIQCLHGRVH